MPDASLRPVLRFMALVVGGLLGWALVVACTVDEFAAPEHARLGASYVTTGISVAWRATCGSVSSGGLYTAPSTTPTTGKCLVIATRTDNARADTATATIASAVVTRSVPFGPLGMDPDSVALASWPSYRATMRLTTSAYVCGVLRTIKANGGRVLLGVGRAKSVDTQGHLSGQAVGDELARWKAACPDIATALADGTVPGLYLTDEPQCASCWGGTTATPLQVDSMGMFAKRLWPGVRTFVRVVPSFWPVTAPAQNITCSWAQYIAKKGTAENWVATQRKDAADRGMCVVFGLNALDGGDGSSGIVGTYADRSTWQMSGAEIVRYGTVFLTARSCLFFSWQYSPTFQFSRPADQLAAIKGFDRRADVVAAMDSLARLAARTPACW